MPRGYRCILIAFVGWLSLANAQNPTAKSQQPKAEANQTYTAPTIPTPPAKAIEPVESPELYGPCNEGEDARNSDLCAQWKAADAARDAADWTYFGVLLGAVGTIGLFWTLYYTRKAVLAAENATKDADSALAIAGRNAEAAAKMAKEARRTNEIARETQLAQLRPYVYIKEMRIEGGRIVLHLQNFGQTPAIELRVASNWALVDADFSGPFPGELYAGAVALELAPSQRIEIGYPIAGVSPTHELELLNGQKMLICELSYGYRDLLGSSFTGHSRQGSKGDGYVAKAFSALPIDA